MAVTLAAEPPPTSDYYRRRLNCHKIRPLTHDWSMVNQNCAAGHFELNRN
jgi:hypothetical protein